MPHWATELAQAMQPQLSASELMIGTVINPSPLTIKVKGVTIRRHIYVNPAYTLADELRIILTFADELERVPKIFGFLQEWHKQYTLDAGDNVIVAQMGTAFYVLSKAVAQ